MSLGFRPQVFDLALAGEKLAGTRRVVVRVSTMFERRDICPNEPKFAVLNPHVGLTNGDVPVADGFDLTSRQGQPSLERLLNEIIMRRPPVGGDYPIPPAIRTYRLGLLRSLCHVSDYRFGPPRRQSVCDRHRGTMHSMDQPRIIVDPYADIAEFYDLEHAEFDEDIDLYLNLASVVGDPILELGCGTGRILSPLASVGHRVTGLDASAAMLERAEQRLAAATQRDQVHLRQANFEDTVNVSGGPFGLTIIALNGFLHAASPTAQRNLLQAARSALDPRGMLVLDVMNPTPVTLQGFDSSLVHEGSWYTGDGTHVSKLASRRIVPTRQLIETELWYDTVAADGMVRRTLTTYPMRWVHPAELELMLELAGYAEWKLYGTYDLDPFSDDSDRLIVTAEVSPS
jgi:SAM-dependent methyltransferase